MTESAQAGDTHIPARIRTVGRQVGILWMGTACGAAREGRWDPSNIQVPPVPVLGSQRGGCNKEEIHRKGGSLDGRHGPTVLYGLLILESVCIELHTAVDKYGQGSDVIRWVRSVPTDSRQDHRPRVGLLDETKRPACRHSNGLLEEIWLGRRRADPLQPGRGVDPVELILYNDAAGPRLQH